MKRVETSNGLLKHLKRLYLVSKKSIPQISVLSGLTKSTVRLRLLGMGVKMRSALESIPLRSDVLGKQNLGKQREFSKIWKKNLSLAAFRRWEGKSKGVSLKPNGYYEITTGVNKGRSLHVVILEKKIGRRLRRNEVGHHKDENKQNNDPDNLEAMTRREHTQLHRNKIYGKL